MTFSWGGSHSLGWMGRRDPGLNQTAGRILLSVALLSLFVTRTSTDALTADGGGGGVGGGAAGKGAGGGTREQGCIQKLQGRDGDKKSKSWCNNEMCSRRSVLMDPKVSHLPHIPPSVDKSNLWTFRHSSHQNPQPSDPPCIFINPPPSFLHPFRSCTQTHTHTQMISLSLPPSLLPLWILLISRSACLGFRV